MARPTKEESIYKVSIHKNGGYMESVRTDTYRFLWDSGAKIVKCSAKETIGNDNCYS